MLEVSVMMFCPKSNGLYPTDFTFLPGSQLTTSNHWLCYCTVPVFVVIYFCFSMWSFWVEVNLCSFYFIFCLYILYMWYHCKGCNRQ